MAGKYYFLCEVFNKQTYIYAIKSNSTDWHYFEEEDSNMNVHTSLPADLGNQTVMINEIHEVSVGLDFVNISSIYFFRTAIEAKTAKFSNVKMNIFIEHYTQTCNGNDIRLNH